MLSTSRQTQITLVRASSAMGIREGLSMSRRYVIVIHLSYKFIVTAPDLSFMIALQS